ncbi:MAG: pilus assembly protein [Hyphomonadaceae bacterium]|nr:pilus assembly protein [Hyphomonadaceae bacterium]
MRAARLFKTLLRRFVRDERAAAALEFALIAPTMLFIAFGTVEITYALQANKRVENVASSLADVISREDNGLTTPELNDLWNAVSPLMWPNRPAGIQVRVSSVLVETPSRAAVVWSEGHGGYAPRAVASTVSLPAGMMIQGSSFIMGEVIYPYRPAIGFVFGQGGLHSLLNHSSQSGGTFNISHQAVRRARILDPVPRILN